jgi:hypothetical protein
MKKLLATIVFASIAILPPAMAQTADPKLEWATKVVALQQGPELERLVNQLADSASQDVLQAWAPKLQANVSKEKMQQARESLNTELKKYFDDVYKTINSKTTKVSTDALIPVYMQKFSLEELKQLVAFFESPAVKKYQAAAPELGNAFVQQLIEATRADVTARGKQFDDAATKIIGSVPAATRPEKSKPAPKK